MTPFTQHLRQHIDQSGKKLNAIANEAHITYNYLYYVLNGTRHPSEQVVNSLATALRLTPEQSGELVAAAGYVPPPMIHISEQHLSFPKSSISNGDSRANLLAQRCYRLTQEIPESLQEPFLDEMSRLLDYARYKYLLCGGATLTELRLSNRALDFQQRPSLDISSLDTIATLVGELWEDKNGETPAEKDASSQTPSQVADLLANIDQLTGSILAGEEVPYQPHLVNQIREILHQGVPWEIKRRITEALPGLSRFDAAGTFHVMEQLRLDQDKKYGVDVRRRVLEAVMPLFEAAPSLYSQIVDLLQPQPGDDIYVALATIEACGDLQTKLRENEISDSHNTDQSKSLMLPLSREQAEIMKLQRHLLTQWNETELECLQYSLALHDLLRAPDALFLSLRDGLHSNDKRLQLIACRYLKRMLSIRPLESLQMYQGVLQTTTSRNVRRTVAHAMPDLLHCLKEAALPIRSLARSVILTMSQDTDLHIRRAVADFAMQLFHIDREFLFLLLRNLHQDRDPAIRHRLQPVALRLAQVWLLWYAETAGLVQTTRPITTTPFGE